MSTVHVVQQDQAYDVEAYPVAVFTNRPDADEWVRVSNHYWAVGMHKHESNDYSIHEVPLDPPPPRDAWEHPEDY